MNDDNISIVFWISVTIGLFLGVTAAVTIGNTTWKDEAVAHGHAEYYLDEHHERQWRWKEAK